MELNELRTEINGIDEQLVDLFRRRMNVAAGIAEYKKEHQLPVYDPARERDVLARVSAQAGEEMEGYTRVLFSTLFDLSRAYQTGKSDYSCEFTGRITDALSATPQLFPQRAVVACQGVEGAYSQIACCKMFDAPSIMYCKSFGGVFQAVQSGLCRFGMLPIENSSYGSVGAVYDLMRNHKFSIVRSLKLHVDHCLLAKHGTALDDVRVIYSHEQAIGQCSEFLAKLPNVRVVACANTAEAARLASESSDAGIAAIASHPCAAIYDLSTLAEHIQNRENNYTRFICITRDLEIYPGAYKLSLMFSLPHTPGSLYHMIARFAALGLNITKLESRPIPGRDFEFMFYVDVDASVMSPDVMQLLGELAQSGETFTFLGNYVEV